MKRIKIIKDGEVRFQAEEPATKDIDSWLSDGIKKNWWGRAGEYQIQIEDIAQEVAQAQLNSEAFTYLAETDWLIIREMDTGVACPDEVKKLRQEARNKIVREEEE